MSTTRLHYVSVGVHGAASADGLDQWSSSSPPARCSLSSYDTLEHFTAKHGADIVPGAPVVDLTPLADRADIVRLAWRAPMCDPTLSADQVDRWNAGADPVGLAPILAASYFGAAGALAAMTTTAGAERGPFDHVSPLELAEYWRRAGARVGYWTGAAIAWLADGSELEPADALELEPAPQLF